jgi:hypothetical protein
MNMVKTLARAVAEAESLPEAAQEKIGRELLVHIEKLRNMRADIEEGARSLDAGGGKELDVEGVIKRARGRNAEG